MSENISRRNFMKGAAGVGGGVAMASFAGAFGISSAQAANDDTQTILNLAATAETLAATSYYYTILNNPIGYDDDAILYFKYALSAELYHLNFLNSVGGKALAQQFYVPTAFLTSKATNSATFQAAETAFTGAYLAATRTFADAGQGKLAGTTAQHAATEAEHLALQRLTGGFIPNPNALPAPIYLNVSDAVPTLAPFLKGGSGFAGPVPFPGVSAINTLLGSVKAFPVPVYASLY